MNNSIEREQTLYRFFDAEDNLLYVGISVRVEKRFHDHQKRSTWWDEAVYVTFEKFPNRQSVLQAEAEAIQTESPKYNKDLNPNYESAMDHFQKLKAWVLTDIEPPEDHAFLVEKLKWARSLDPYWKSQSKHMAYQMIEGFPYLTRHNAFCDNCKGIYEKGFLYDWAKYSAHDRNEEPSWQL